MKPRLFVSVSGGRTSWYLANKLRKEYEDQYEMLFGFANTGKERRETLDFNVQCSREFGVDLVWLEAVVSLERGVGTAHKVVTYDTASRNGEPFEAVIRKYGIPNKSYPHCTRELKLNPIRSYLASVGWTVGTYVSAVGIRSDEMKRVRKDAEKAHLVYPLVHWFPTTKPEINDWWEEQSFNLQLQEHQGNCDACWKKSTQKLVRIAQETPAVFGWWSRMETTYPLAGAGHGETGLENPRSFFRQHQTARTILTISEMGQTAPIRPDYQKDEDSGCSESCEAFGGQDELSSLEAHEAA